MGRHAKYLLIIVDTWSRTSEMTSTYHLYRIAKESLEIEEKDVAREKYEEMLNRLLKLEANAYDR